MRRLLRILWTRLMTKKQMNEMAQESELLSHVKSDKLHYFRHVMRLQYDSIESRIMLELVECTEGWGRPRIG